MWYRDNLTALAFCWRLQRADGVAFGFTSHDRDLDFGGMTYRAAPGMVPSAIERRADLDAAAVELRGALSSGSIIDDDIDAGRWDKARLRVYAVDASDPATAPALLIDGTLGGFDSDGRAFNSELRGRGVALDRAIVEETSPECRALLGDKRCRVDLAGRKIMARVMACTGATLSVDAELGSDDRYAWGMLRWLDGENAGLSATIHSSYASSITLREPVRRQPQPGAVVELTEGCDKRFATCSARFNNAANFRGEPHLPGNDLLVRYAR